MKPIDPRLLARSAAVRRHLLWSVALGTAVAAVVVAQAWWLSTIIADGFHGHGLAATVTTAIAGVGLCFAMRAVLGWVHELTATRASAVVKSQLRREVMGAVLDDRPTGADRETGHLIALLASGLDSLDAYFARYLPQLVLAVTVPVVVGGAILWADPLAAVTVAVTLPLIVVFMVLVGWLTKERTERRWSALKRLTHHYVDVLDGLTVLKIFGRSRAQVIGLREVGERHRRSTMRALRLAFLSSLVLELFATIAVALVAVGVGLRVLEGHLGLQTGLFVLILAPEMFLPLRRVGALFHDSADGAAAAQDALDLIAERKPESVGERPAEDGDIEVDAVAVRYAGRTRDALPATSLRVGRGEIVALTGPSGCGKSTLLATVLGLVEPSSGQVRIGGVALADLDLAAWRRQVAWVPQSPALLAGSVESNVRFGLVEPSAHAVRTALRDAAAIDLRLDREVRDRGGNLSAGERRRVGIARALLRVRRAGARVILLDEPTAGLDAEAESKVLATLRSEGVTVIVVAHRPTVIAAADRTVEVGELVPT